VQPGWASFALDGAGRAPSAEGARVTLRGGREAAGAIGEVHLAASPVPSLGPTRLAVTYPLHGECVGGKAYLRGFVTSPSDGARGATMAIAGRAPVDGAVELARDGAFGVVVSPPARGRRAPWTATVTAHLPSGDEVSRAISIGACAPPPVAAAPRPGEPVVDEGAPFGQVVRAGEAATISFAGAELEIPAGAVTDDVRI